MQFMEVKHLTLENIMEYWTIIIHISCETISSMLESTNIKCSKRKHIREREKCTMANSQMHNHASGIIAFSPRKSL